MERRRLSDETYRAGLVGQIRPAITSLDGETTIVKLWKSNDDTNSEELEEMWSNLDAHNKSRLRTALQVMHGQYKTITVQDMREVESPEALRELYPSRGLGKNTSTFLFEIFSVDEELS